MTDPTTDPHAPGDDERPREHDEGPPRILPEYQLVPVDEEIPPEEHPRLESLAAISGPARAASIDKLYRLGPDEEPELPELVLYTTPEELGDHVHHHIEEAIKRRIDKGELKRVDWDSDG